jgi:hypothetical protein
LLKDAVNGKEKIHIQSSNYGNQDADLYYMQAKCHFLLQELDAMKEDLITCVSRNPRHQYALALLSLIETAPTSIEFAPFPSRNFKTKKGCINMDTATHFTPSTVLLPILHPMEVEAEKIMLQIRQ